jgi:hypothetical protein
MQNKERHFCFVYIGNRLHIPDFNQLKFNLVEGCCESDGSQWVQFVKVTLHPNNGRRIGSIPKIIDEYNLMEGRNEKVEPIVYYPHFQTSSVVCFKTKTPVQNNPILKRIAQEQQKENGSFWRWVSSQGKGKSHIPSEPLQPSRRRLVPVTSIHDILREMQLPESIVSVQRVYDELSEPYFREYSIPLGEGTGCIPLEHRGFVVSEIRRLFEEELSYIEQPSVVVSEGALPLNARALVENAGWMGDILLSGEGMEAVTGGAIIRAVRAENELMRRQYVCTGLKKSDRLERRGVGNSLREFFVFYAIRWNTEGLDSVCKLIEELHSGWTPPLEPLISFQGLIAGISLKPCVVVDGPLLRIASVERLVKLLCNEGLIAQSPVVSSRPVKRMTVQEECVPVPSILSYFKTMLDKEWRDSATVEVTAAEVVRVLNGGDVGAYRKSCVSQFMRPFLFDGSVEGYFWRDTGGIRCEKYVVHVSRVVLRVNQFK